MNNKIKLSVIIVHYKNDKDLIECLDSLYKQEIKQSFEVIIVDNSENNSLQSILNKKKYRNLRYILSPKNLGYGAGMNLGTKHAKGEFLFVLNPDVVFKTNIISILINNFNQDKNIGIIAPLLYTVEGKTMDQGAKEPTPLRALIKYSFIDKILPNNFISKNFWEKNWKKDKLNEVDNVPGTAFIIKKNLFENIGGFDEKFFLYFEEFDLCKRVREAGYKIFIDSNLKLMHKWGTTTRLLKNKDEIFKKSRFYYFKKHYGLLKAIFIESFLLINKASLSLLTIILLSFLVRFYKVESLVPFIGDQGWFFISAKNSLISSQIPLVGITSSHLWLHQGPLWTYILMVLFKMFSFNPIVPFIFTAFIDGLVVILIYKLITNMFSQRIALFATIIYAFSPMVILSARMSYHTTLIPLFILLFIYSLFKFVKGNKYHFPLAIFYLSVLYNLELQASMLGILFLIVTIFGFIKKQNWFKNILTKKILLLSFVAFLISMIPILIYDIYNGFPQTIVFAGWIIYKGISFLIKLIEGESTGFSVYILILDYFYEFIRKLIYIQNGILSLIIFLLSLAVVFYKFFKEKVTKDQNLGIFIVTIIFLFLVGGILVSKTPSEAYLMSLFIPSILLVSIMFDYIANSKKKYLLVLCIVLLISFLNMYNLISNDYFTGIKNNFGPNFLDRVKTVKEIIKESKEKSITVIGRGEGSQFESFTDNYKYLLWYYGKTVKDRDGEIIYVLSEGRRGITIDRR